MLLQRFSAVLFILAVSVASVGAQHDHHRQESDSHQHEQTPSAGPQAKSIGERQVGPHGGMLGGLGDLQTETVIEPGGLRLFVYDQNGKPIDLRDARGVVMLQVAGDAKRYRYDLFPEMSKDRSARSLAAAVDLSRSGGRQVDLNWQLVGIAGTERRLLKFAVQAKVPLTEAQQVAEAIKAQVVCPVSGHPLGSMGKSVPVRIGDQTVYVCCASCIDAVKANSAKYLSKLRNPEVTKATKEDTECVAAQKLCPVMDEPLGSMGGPYRTVVKGHVVYLCCPGCAGKLHANPDGFLQKLEGRGVRVPRVR